MRSLVFLCAQKVVSDHASICRALEFIPKELYPVLFKASFVDRKTLVLQDLVQRWPFPILSIQKLLQSCKHCDRLLIKEKPSKLCVQAVILGVLAYLNQAMEGEERTQQLRVLNMMGLQDDSLEQDPETMSLWSQTVTLSKACVDMSQRYSEGANPLLKRRKGACSPSAATSSLGSRACVEVHMDLFVNSTSSAILREALQVSSSSCSPLRLRCRDFRAEELSIRSTLGLLELLSPASIRQVDLRFNNLGLPGLNVLLPYMAKFTSLLSLKLPYNNVDVRRLSVEMEAGLQNFAVQLGRLANLRELNLGSSRLSGRLRQLLGGLQKPLESLELAFCYLLPSDLTYLSRSLHAASLKKLDLSGNSLCEPLLQPFQLLLSEASGSLLHLDVMECKLMDSHLGAVLPALCRCTHLRYLGIFCNPISTRGLKRLLQSTLPLPDLRLVIYPYPMDCYSESLLWPASSSSFLDSSFDQEKLSQVNAELQQMLAHSQRTDVVWSTDMYRYKTLEYLNL
ncbi:leucine-rich repeat-containing protein 14 [Rhinatrema bivittatum]|uniref:leucine-rich repeat-containing protein 14 n=1 Tax=Rhinatrema bivittatum TaxID=194408 RepID=UPI0011292B5E|nr:leucine-rich repeat-containing protein 14 [Rhinatrema bivittatum]XP_029448077.1 leucine-rich repeat-containing protein 14 [Rhinatrema bivittatum]